jgi:hypothetical protein
MRVLIVRTKMIGGGLSYDALVPIEDVPEHITRSGRMQIWREGRKYYDYVDATESVEHHQMPVGNERYEHRMEHEKKALREAMVIATSVCPELAESGRELLPQLWLEGLSVEATCDRHSEFWVDTEELALA